MYIREMKTEIHIIITNKHTHIISRTAIFSINVLSYLYLYVINLLTVCVKNLSDRNYYKYLSCMQEICMYEEQSKKRKE